MDINTQAAKPNRQKKPNEDLLKPHIKVIQTQKSWEAPTFHFSVLIFNFYHNMLLVDLGEQLVMSG